MVQKLDEMSNQGGKQLTEDSDTPTPAHDQQQPLLQATCTSAPSQHRSLRFLFPALVSKVADTTLSLTSTLNEA